jgi:hypothetical protein
VPCDLLLTLDGKRSVLSPRLGIGVYQCWAFQQKFKSAFGSLSTPEMGEKETGVSSALKPLGRSRSPPLWRPPRCSELADKCIAIVRPSSPPLWKPVPLSQARSQAVLTPSVMKINGLHGQFAQSTSRLQLAPPRPLFNGPTGLLPSIPPSTVLIEDALTGREALAPRKQEALTPAMKCHRCLGPIRQWWVSSCRSVLG